jgi:hypothetical protein
MPFRYLARIASASETTSAPPTIGANTIANAKIKAAVICSAWILKSADPFGPAADRVAIIEAETGREICARGVAKSKWIRCAPLDPTTRTAAARARATGDRLKRVEFSAFPAEAETELRAAAAAIKARAMAARSTARALAGGPDPAALDHAARGRET